MWDAILHCEWRGSTIYIFFLEASHPLFDLKKYVYMFFWLNLESSCSPKMFICSFSWIWRAHALVSIFSNSLLISYSFSTLPWRVDTPSCQGGQPPLFNFILTQSTIFMYLTPSSHKSAPLKIEKLRLKPPFALQYSLFPTLLQPNSRNSFLQYVSRSWVFISYLPDNSQLFFIICMSFFSCYI